MSVLLKTFLDPHGKPYALPYGEEVAEATWAYALVQRGETILLTRSPTTRLQRLPGQEIPHGIEATELLVKFTEEQTGVRLSRCYRLKAGTCRDFYHNGRFYEANILCYQGELPERPLGTPPCNERSCWMRMNRLPDLTDLHPLSTALLEQALGIRFGMPTRWEGRHP